jgi:hypothetical protein
MGNYGDKIWWFDIARCRGKLHIFISPGPNTEACRRICETCDAIDVCFWHAVAREQQYDEGRPLRFGIFGGMSARERSEYVGKYHINSEVAEREYERQKEILWIRLGRPGTRPG